MWMLNIHLVLWLLNMWLLASLVVVIEVQAVVLGVLLWVLKHEEVNICWFRPLAEFVLLGIEIFNLFGWDYFTLNVLNAVADLLGLWSGWLLSVKDLGHEVRGDGFSFNSWKFDTWINQLWNLGGRSKVCQHFYYYR